MSTQSQRTWDREGWGQEEIQNLRTRLTASANMFTALNDAITRQSLAKIEASLAKYRFEVQSGKRTSSVSSQQIDSISADNKEAWKKFQRELEDIGLAADVLEKHGAYIILWFKKAFEAGELEEQEMQQLLGRENSIEHSEPTLWHTAASRISGIDQGNLAEGILGVKSFEVQRRDEGLMKNVYSQRGKGIQAGVSAEVRHSKVVELDNALIEASRQGDVSQVEKLLGSGADLSNESSFGELALHIAVSKGHEAIVGLLLEKTADVNARDGNGWTALRWAVGIGHENIVRLLLEKGVDMEAKDSSDWTVLHWAARRGHPVFAKLLLENGASPDTRDDGGFAAIHLAAWNGHSVIVEQLAVTGADLSLQDWWGDTALSLALRRGHETVIRVLLRGIESTMALQGKSLPLLALEDKSDKVTQFLMQRNILDRHETFETSQAGLSSEDWKRLVYTRSIQNQSAEELFSDAHISGPGMKSR